MQKWILGFPFEWLGNMLRSLSLGTEVGNVIAIVIYVFISLSPVIIRLVFIKKKHLQAEDMLLPVLSVLLFGTIYLMINPTMIPVIFGDVGTLMNASIFGACIYSVIVGYFLICMIRKLVKLQLQEFKKCLAPLMWFMNIMYVCIILGEILPQYVEALGLLKAIDRFSVFNVSVISLIYLMEIVPYVLNVFVLFALFGLFRELGADEHSDGALNAAGRLSRISFFTLIITILGSVTVNIVWLMAAPGINSVKTTVIIPVEQIVFLVVTLLMSMYIGKNKKLKEDNDSFI